MKKFRDYFEGLPKYHSKKTNTVDVSAIKKSFLNGYLRRITGLSKKIKETEERKIEKKLSKLPLTEKYLEKNYQMSSKYASLLVKIDKILETSGSFEMGSGRMVIPGSKPNTVIKFAHSRIGIIQNANEKDFYELHADNPIVKKFIPKLYSYDKESLIYKYQEKSIWLEFEKVATMTMKFSSDWAKQYGYRFDKMGVIAEQIKNKYRRIHPQIEEDYKNITTLSKNKDILKFIEFLIEENVEITELFMFNWGVTKSGNPVLLDLGINTDTEL